jgi:anionic cell wall polymer biosynthesis LytR-Cps2A-Psr (LCP) family protein
MLAVLSCIMIAVVMAVQPGMPKKAQTPILTEEIIFRPQAADTLTVVVIGIIENAATEFLLIRFNPQCGQVPLALLPPQTQVLFKGQPSTLSQVYETGGANAVKGALHEQLGIVIDRYAKLTLDPFLRLAQATGTVVYALPYDISYTDRKGYSVNLSAGERRLDGRDIANLFEYPDLRADPIKRSEFLGGLTAAVINQNLKAAGNDISSKIFKLAVNLLDTDISFADYEYRRDAADFVSKLNLVVAGNLIVSGEFLEDKPVFVLSDQAIELIRTYFQTGPP